MVDVFEEVEEQLRATRYQTLIAKGWPFAVGAAVAALLIVGVVWGWGKYQTSLESKASETYAQALEALGQGHNDVAQRGFAQIARGGPAGYKSLALMQLGGLSMTARKTDEAVRYFDQAAAAAPQPLIGDAARLKAAYALFDTTSQEDLAKRLTPLTAANRPYANLAREALAMKELATGHAAQARSALSVLSISPDVTDDLRNRAQATIAAIDSGTTSALPAVIKAAEALPPGYRPPAPPRPPAAQGPQIQGQLPPGVTPEQAQALIARAQAQAQAQAAQSQAGQAGAAQ